MTEKVPHTEENILGYVFKGDEIIPFWEDNVPPDIKERMRDVGATTTSLTMAHPPRSGRKPPLPEPE